MQIKNLEGFNWDLTLLGGQSFAWDFLDGKYYGCTHNYLIICDPIDFEIKLVNCRGRKIVNENFIKKYFRLGIDYENIIKSISKDEHIVGAINKYSGLRLLEQDFEECLLSYLVTPTNNIPSIRYRIRNMNKMFGEKVLYNGQEFYLFPKTKVLSDASECDLRACKLGFHAKFIKQVASSLICNGIAGEIINVQNQLKCNEISNVDAENKVRKILISLPGVGQKIADCVMLYSLGFDRLFPLDVWGKRILVNCYHLNPEMKYEEMRIWIQNYFGKYTGWASQFLFEYFRLGNEKFIK